MRSHFFALRVLNRTKQHRNNLFNPRLGDSIFPCSQSLLLDAKFPSNWMQNVTHFNPKRIIANQPLVQMISFQQGATRGFVTPRTNPEDSWEQLKTDNLKSSNRSTFKNIPIDQSILSYIRSIGVGMRPKKKRHRPNSTTGSSKRSNERGGVLSEKDEKLFFDTKYNFKGSRRRPSRVSDDDNEVDRTESFMPPPPFSSQNLRQSADDVTETGQIIKRLPVKILGTVGSSADEMPRSSKGLPEVAIVGRSNVGKSTLLNVSAMLLYFD